MIKPKLILYLLVGFLCFMASLAVFAYPEDTDNQICAVYLTGIGCPACAHVEPILLSELTKKLPQLVIIEYEIYKSRKSNIDTAQEYFSSYLPPNTPTNIPFLILDKESFMGAGSIKNGVSKIIQKTSGKCPLPGRNLLPLKDVNLSELQGQPRIWTKNRVFILESDDFIPGITRDVCIRKLIKTKNIISVLQDIEFTEVDPEPVVTSRGELHFQNAVIVGNWRLQWDGDPLFKEAIGQFNLESIYLNWIPLILAFFLGLLFTVLILKRKQLFAFLKHGKTDFLIITAAVIVLIGFFIIALNISSGFLEDLGYHLPLPLFTFIIALIDGFNPCNMFVLTVLLTLLISSSASRKRLYLVGLIFIFIVFLFYLLFMAAWINIFKYIGFAGPLRIIIAIIAISAGLINCKEFLFFKKGPSLMISEKHKGTLYAKMRNITEIINKGSLPLLISSSITLAIFSSLIEIPCTAGFPILYTSVLASQIQAGKFFYMFYLIFYNLIYVIPLLVIIGILGFSFRGKRISQRQVQIIKLIGGLIMILLGIILLVNPELIGASL